MLNNKTNQLMNLPSLMQKIFFFLWISSQSSFSFSYISSRIRVLVVCGGSKPNGTLQCQSDQVEVPGAEIRWNYPKCKNCVFIRALSNNSIDLPSLTWPTWHWTMVSPINRHLHNHSSPPWTSSMRGGASLSPFIGELTPLNHEKVRTVLAVGNVTMSFENS